MKKLASCYALSYPYLINHVSNCCYFRDDSTNDDVVLENVNTQDELLKIASESSFKRERMVDDKTSDSMSNFVSIVGTLD